MLRALDNNQQKGKGGREGKERQDLLGIKSHSREEECRWLVARSALKIAARKAERLKVGQSWRVKSMGNQQGEEREEEVEDSGLFYEPFIPHASPLSSDGQHIATCYSA